MPVGRWGRLEVDGRRVLVFDGINTQTVNVYEGTDENGEKQIIIRLRQPLFTSAEQLDSLAFSTIDELQAYLVSQHGGEVEEPLDRRHARFSDTLAEIAAGLRSGGESPTPTVREFLAMVGAQRRGQAVVAAIRELLAENSLVTAPDFQAAYVDSYIRFVLVDPVVGGTTTGEPDQEELAWSASSETYADPTYRISKFPTANRAPERVHPDETLRSAMTKMDLTGVAYLPVMESDRKVNGVLSLKSVLARWERARPESPVREYMDYHSAEIVDSTASFFSVLSRLRDHDYILVRGQDMTIVGSITAADMVPAFREMTEPFLLLSEIEHHVRGLIAPRFTPEELQEICCPDLTRELDSVDRMTFGDYVYLLQSPGQWDRLGLGSDGSAVMERMRRVNEIRNRVMHFDPDGIEPDDLEELRAFSRFLRRLRSSETS